MKRIICMALVLACMAGYSGCSSPGTSVESGAQPDPPAETMTPETASVQDWGAAYKAKIREVANGYSPMFSIRDIGGDEVPELIVSADDGTYFYAYQDGIREIAVLDAGYMEYDPEDGVIVYTSEPALNGKTDRYGSWNGQEMTDSGKGGSGDHLRLSRDFDCTDCMIEAACTEKASWQECYSDFLNAYIAEYTINPETNPTTFSLHDLDADGIPELCVSQGDYHAASVWIFTYRGYLVSYGLHGAYGSVGWYPEQQMLGFGDVHMGYFMAVYSVLNREALAFCDRYVFEDNSGGLLEGEQELYRVNYEEVSKEEYERIYREQIPQQDPVYLGADFPLTPENVASAIAAY